MHIILAYNFLKSVYLNIQCLLEEAGLVVCNSTEGSIMAQRKGKKEFRLRGYQCLNDQQEEAQPWLHQPSEVPVVAKQLSLPCACG